VVVDLVLDPVENLLPDVAGSHRRIRRAHCCAVWRGLRRNGELSPVAACVFTEPSSRRRRNDGRKGPYNPFRHRGIAEKSASPRLPARPSAGFPQFFPQLWKSREETPDAEGLIVRISAGRSRRAAQNTTPAAPRHGTRRSADPAPESAPRALTGVVLLDYYWQFACPAARGSSLQSHSKPPDTT
jgi:hypothetical protein